MDFIFGKFEGGKWVQNRPNKIKSFTNFHEISVTALMDLWEGTPKTLRSGLSRTYQLFEPCGLLAPIAGQTRAALHEIVKTTGNDMDAGVKRTPMASPFAVHGRTIKSNDL